MLLDQRPLASLVLACLGGLIVAPATRAQVHDAAHLFHPDAIRKANRRIEEIHSRFGKTLLIDTIKAPDAKAVEKINLKDAKMRRKFFDEWVEERITKADLDGVYVLICEDPPLIRVVVRPDSMDTLFTEDNRKFLRGELIARLQPDNPDRGGVRKAFKWLRGKRPPDDALLWAVDYVGDKLVSNGPVDRTKWVQGMTIIGGVLCFWTLLIVVRARLRKRTPPEAGVRVEDESGRSIAVLGGGIGAVSGQWLFDRVFQRRRPAVAPVTETGDSSEELPEEP